MKARTRLATVLLLTPVVGSMAGCFDSGNGDSALERCKGRSGLSGYLCTNGASLVPDFASQCSNVSSIDGFDFNGLFAGSFSSSGSGTEGSLGVVGDASVSNYTVGSKADSSQPSLDVGGQLSVSGGSVTGSIATSDTTPEISGGAAGSTITHQTPDLKQLFDRMNLESRLLSLLPTTGATDTEECPANGLNFHLTGDRAALNVFSIDAAELSRARSMSINVPEGASVIINVTGTELTLTDHDITLENGLTANHVIWNSSTLTHLEAHGIALEGSYLLPRAAVSFSDGELNGTLLATSFSGNGQLNKALFDGCYPPTDRIGQFFFFNGIQSLERDAAGSLLASWQGLDPSTQVSGYNVYVRSGQGSYSFATPTATAGAADSSKAIADGTAVSKCAVVRATGLPFDDANTTERCAIKSLGLSTISSTDTAAQQGRLSWDGVNGLPAETMAQLFVRTNPGNYDFTQPAATLLAASATVASFPLTGAQAGSYCAVVRYVSGATVVGQSDERCVSVASPTLTTGPAGLSTSASYTFGFGGGATSYRAVVLSGDVACPATLSGAIMPIATPFAGTAPNANGANTLCAIGYGADGVTGSAPTRQVWTVDSTSAQPVDFAVTGLPNGYSPTFVPTLTGTVTSATATQYRYALQGRVLGDGVIDQSDTTPVTPCSSVTTWSAWTALSAPLALSVAPHVNYTLCVAARNGAGTIAPAKTLSFYALRPATSVQVGMTGTAGAGNVVDSPTTVSVVENLSTVTPPGFCRAASCTIGQPGAAYTQVEVFGDTKGAGARATVTINPKMNRVTVKSSGYVDGTGMDVYFTQPPINPVIVSAGKDAASVGIWGAVTIRLFGLGANCARVIQRPPTAAGMAPATVQCQ